MISFVVPAHNEQACLGRTLQAIHESARVVDQPYEVIVVDDASTDATSDLARQNNARVVSVNHRQIAATRNSGGRAAPGERLFFVDADTTINPRAVASALRYMDKGAVGGGAPTLFEGIVPLYIRLVAFLITIVLLTGPIWYSIPRSLTPLASPLGKFRFVIGTFLCHAGLVFWPFAVLPFWNLFGRKHWIEWFKLAALFAFCLWQALESTQGVIRIWTRLYHWLAYFYNG